MDILIKDNQSQAILYGQTLLDEIIRTGKSRPVKVYKVEAEAWIAFLQLYHSHLAEVAIYLEAVKRTGSINPREGLLLKAVDDRLDISIEEWEAALKAAGIMRAG
jgi:hypothetical protein